MTGVHDEFKWLADHPEFEECPATFEEFLGPNYLNIEGMLRPRILEEMKKLFGTEVDPYRIATYSEGLVTGGIGIGKTTIASVVLPYMAHWVLCLKDPQKFFNLLPGSRIAFMMMSTSEAQALEVVFGDVKARIAHSPWFQAQYKPDPRLKNKIIFEKDIWIIPGDSKETTFEGYNILGGILDEGDSHQVTKNKDYAEVGYTTISSRITSRFQDRGFLLVIGQMKRANGFMARKYNEFVSRKDAYAVRLAIWDSMGKDFYLDKDGGKVFTYDTLRRRIIPGAIGTLMGNPKHLIEVPELYRRQFDQNPEKALRDLAGIPPLTGNPFISLVDRIIECRDRWIEIFGPDSPVDLDGRIAPWFKAKDSLPRALHLDIAYSAEGDALGIAMGHVREMVDIDGELKPLVCVDMLMRIKAMPGTEIFLSDVRQIIYSLRDDRGFNIRMITCDGFQCLTGDTIIPLLDGTHPTIAELAQTHPEGGFWTYSVKDGRIVPGKGLRAWKTGTRSVISVKLDNGESVRCTHDHLFMMRDGSYRQACDLRAGDSLMPLYRDVTPDDYKGLRGYERVLQPGPRSISARRIREGKEWTPGRWQYTHRMVAGNAPKGHIIHHADFTKRNNDPDNLVVMELLAHIALHKDHGGGVFRELWRNSEFRARTSKAVSLSNSERTGRQSRRFRHDVTLEGLTQYAHLNRADVTRATGYSQDVIYSRIREAGYSGWADFKAQVNHKVVEVRDDGETEDVFDLTIDEVHNFAVGAGVFVHNSTDSMQQFQKRRFNVDYLSVDKQLLPYSDLRDAIYERRLNFPPLMVKMTVNEMHTKSEILIQELSELMDMGTKVDHPEQGSKDVADALAGVVHTLMGDRKYQRRNGNLLTNKRVNTQAPAGRYGIRNHPAVLSDQPLPLLPHYHRR